ncbi:hypothetical protein DV711_16960 [Motiliproteus coralliicola]|uniref:Plasmid replication protein RepB n=1 Tax=Motiliproteus coralliicola TaxID=2283196 RepID=A0A369W9K2_9GAMM|nr:hypothetical protein [Motiliproteus coralliicola]RDE18347.1 hypothetical protein DV711_16960 [Motiliproteus coralliicola]
MQERELKLLYNAGFFELCRAVPVSMAKGWTLKFRTKDNREETLMLQRGQREREFKSLDGAVSVARKIGFDWVRVEIGEIQWDEQVG